MVESSGIRALGWLGAKGVGGLGGGYIHKLTLCN